MNFGTETSMQTEGGTNRSQGFKADVYQKSLNPANPSGVTLSTVHNNQQQNFGSMLELLANNGFLHNESTLTAGETGIDGEPSLIQEQNSITLGNPDSQLSQQFKINYSTSVRNMSIPRGKYMTQAGQGEVTSMYRNSSTVEKPKNFLNVSVNPAEQQPRITSNSSSLIGPIKKGQGFELTTLMHQSMKNLPTGGDYATAINILPVIGSEISLETDQFSRTSSKVELTKKEIQNFIVNGSVSKAFIQQNKKELTNFIKNQARSTNDYFRGYEEYGNKKNTYEAVENIRRSNQSMDGLRNNSQQSTIEMLQNAQRVEGGGVLNPIQGRIPMLKRKLIGSATIHVEEASARKRNNSAKKGKKNTSAASLDRKSLVFPNDVKLEHKFKGETSSVSNRVLETWINETLTDAYHLDIPGVLMKPEHKNPISRYGIDRQSLVNSGVSPQEVDRIYRSLFVYSVGFFELLKKILSCTSKNFQIITSIWKVFQVLLEYCCKTDYRILIAEITDKHNQQLELIQAKFKEKIQTYIETEKVLKQNMETMRDYNDHLEKDRANEKQLRLKLEEEYMQNTKNHEEEVKLRLKFEGKFNTMHDTHRELQIRHERTLKEFFATQQQLAASDNEAKNVNQELNDLQKLKTQQDTLITQLQEYKQLAEKDLKKKNMTLATAEERRSQAVDGYQLQRYEVQESQKDLNDIKVKMEVQQQEIIHLRGVCASNQMEKDEIEKARLKYKEKYQGLKKGLNERIGLVEAADANLQKERKVSSSYLSELETVRARLIKVEKELDELKIYHAEVIEARKHLKVENAKLEKENTLNQERLKKMNEERHNLIKELEEMTDKAKSFENQRDNARENIVELKEEIVKKDDFLQGFKIEQFRKEAVHDDQKRLLREQIVSLEQDVTFRQSQVDQYTMLIQIMKDREKEEKIKKIELDNTMLLQSNQVEKLTLAKTLLEQDLIETKAKLWKLESIVQASGQSMEDAIAAKVLAEEIAATLEETVKSLQLQMLQEKVKFNSDNQMFYLKCQKENERDCMLAEEYVSRFSFMETQFKEALQEKAANREKLESFERTLILVGTLEAQKKQIYKEVEMERYKTEKLQIKIQDLEAEVSFVKESSSESLKKMVNDHNIEVASLEQTIQKARIETAKLKSDSMKKTREDMTKIQELQKAVRLAEAGGQKNNKNSKIKNSLLPELVEKGVQTVPVKKPTPTKPRRSKNSQSASKESLEITDQTPATSRIGEKESESGEEIVIDPETETEQKKDNQDKKIPSSRASKFSKAQNSIDLTPRILSVRSEPKQNPRVEEYIRWLQDQEKAILERVEKQAEMGQVVTTADIKQMRSEIRVPAMYRQIKLSEDELAEVDKLQHELAEYYKNRTLRKLEEGSMYSSEFEEVEVSEYVSTDGEGEVKLTLDKANIKVIHDYANASRNDSPQGSSQLQLRPEHKTGSFGGATNNSAQPLIHDQPISMTQLVPDDQMMAQTQKQTSMLSGISPEMLNSQMSGQKESQGSDELRSSAADKIFKHLQQKKEQEEQRKLAGNQEESTYHHEIDESIPVTQYVINKNAAGKDVYRRRVVKKQKVKKTREEEYWESRRRVLSAHAKQKTDEQFEAKEQTMKQYTNIFSNFASNYSKTIELLVEESKAYLRKKAAQRRKMGQNNSVQNIQGREPFHKLIQQMKDTPAWQLHLARLKEELTQQESKWQNREEEYKEIERRREEIRKLEEEAERERSQDRMKKTQIIREDLELQEKEKEDAKNRIKAQQMMLLQKQNDQSIQSDEKSQEVVFEKGFDTQSRDSKDAGLKNYIDLDQFSVWSEDQMHQVLSQRDAQNPQGEDEEMKVPSELDLILQNSLLPREPESMLDRELSELTKGGVAAINRQSVHQNTQIQNEILERQQNAMTRAQEKDIVLMQKGMLTKKQEELKKKPAKLGPSTIRTLIRAADSRKD